MPHDLIRVSLSTGAELLWEVQAVLLGGEGEESVVRLSPVGPKPNPYGPTLIPAQMLDMAISTGAVRHYRLAELEAAGLLDRQEAANADD